MSALDALIKSSAPATGKAIPKPGVAPARAPSNISPGLDSLLAASKPGSSSKVTAPPALPFSESKAPDYNPEDSTAKGILKNTIKGLPSAAVKVAKGVGNYLYDTAGGIIAPGITHDELRDPTLLKDTATGIPKAIYKTGKQVVTHPIDSAQAAVGGAARGISDFVTNAIINLTPEKVLGTKRDNVKEAVKETLDKYLSPDVLKKKSGAAALDEGFHAGGQVAPLILVGEAGGAVGGGIGEAAGFVGAGQTQLPLDASISERAHQAMNDLVGLGLFKVGSYGFNRAFSTIRTGLRSQVNVPDEAQHTAESLGSSGHDLDRAIEAGDIPVEKVYSDKFGRLTPEYAMHTVSDLAGKLDLFKPGLGEAFKNNVDTTSNPTPLNLDNQALAFLNEHVPKGEAVDVIPTRETSETASQKQGVAKNKATVEVQNTPAGNIDELIDQSKPKNIEEAPVTQETKPADVTRETPKEAAPIEAVDKGVSSGENPVVEIGKKNNVEISARPEENGTVHIDKFNSTKPGEGNFKLTLDDLKKWADENNTRITLTPGDDFKTTPNGEKIDSARLEKTLRDKGFTDNPNADKEIGKLVYEPKTAQTSGGRILEPIGTGETKTSRLALNIEQNAIEKGFSKKFGDLPEYQTVNLKEQAKLAADLLKADASRALRIALGDEKPPNNILPEMVLDAVERQAIKAGDVETLRDLSRSKLTSEATAMGQRIRSLAERDQDSPVKAMQDVIKSREEALKRRNKGKDISKLKKEAVDGIKKEIKKASPKKEDWQSFIKSIQC